MAVNERQDIESTGDGPGFVFHSNRGAGLFSAALAPLGGRPYVQGENSTRIELLYFDDYQGNTAQNTGDTESGYEKLPPLIPENCLTLIPRSRTRALDDKAEMARTLMAEGICYPRVYFSVDSVPDAGSEFDERLWFVKKPFSSGGKGISVLATDELSAVTDRNIIIQEAVQDLSLIEGRKYTLRLYVLAYGGKLYLYQDGFVVVHGRPFQRGSKDPLVQFVHEGYLQPESGIELIQFSRLSDAAAILAHAANTLSNNFRAFSNRLKYERDTHYCLFGVDLLVRENLHTVLVEINDRPNLVHSQEINREVNIPMLQAMVLLMKPEWGGLYANDEPDSVSRKFILLTEL